MGGGEKFTAQDFMNHFQKYLTDPAGLPLEVIKAQAARQVGSVEVGIDAHSAASGAKATPSEHPLVAEPPRPTKRPSRTSNTQLPGKTLMQRRAPVHLLAKPDRRHPRNPKLPARQVTHQGALADAFGNCRRFRSGPRGKRDAIAWRFTQSEEQSAPVMSRIMSIPALPRKSTVRSALAINRLPWPTS